jgi:hypothetical protein
MQTCRQKLYKQYLQNLLRHKATTTFFRFYTLGSLSTAKTSELKIKVFLFILFLTDVIVDFDNINNAPSYSRFLSILNVFSYDLF